MPNYNPKTYYVEDEDQRDQCQFVYTPQDGEKPQRCQRDGIYRIGLTIFLCGYHMPGNGRNPHTKPVKIKRPAPPRACPGDTAIETRMLDFFRANPGQVISYADIQERFPVLDSRQYIFIVISKMRRFKGARLVNVTHVGYRYLGQKD